MTVSPVTTAGPPFVRGAYFTTLSTPIGELGLVGDHGALLEVLLPKGNRGQAALAAGRVEDRSVFRDAIDQLDAYFEGTLRRFELASELEGTEFQLKVWRGLAEIGYGQTESYGALAARVGSPRASRAVGSANNRNPLAIVLPCHRVIGANGALVGYGGGLETKRWLLDHEAEWLAADRAT